MYHYGEIEKGSGKRPTSQTGYEIGSITKTFTALLLAQAVTDKKVSLSDDIRAYLPGNYPNLQVASHPITVQDLANHTACHPCRPILAINQAIIRLLQRPIMIPACYLVG